jgi:hypothetical protein
MLRQRFGIKSPQWGEVKEKSRYFAAICEILGVSPGVGRQFKSVQETLFFLPCGYFAKALRRKSTLYLPVVQQREWISRSVFFGLGLAHLQH